MKKIYLLLILVFSVAAYSQAISVSTNAYNVPQLVNNVLINSPCVSATNITWTTGTNFGSSNGIGYFENTNPNFPMQSGVVLTTGSATNAAGPNTTLLNDGSANWIGDSDLEATLAAAGIPMASVNATILEFDFTPISSNFSFDFIFASEEYGNYQCQFSDAFAFLLTNMNTGVTTNLAVVPTTNTPISVVTIRDFIYNSSCPSANAQYFGTFNGGSAAANAAINFNGQTVMMNASSALTPNTPYHIKLVIADRTDFEADSAIFLSSDSFNIGQDVLGEDLTVAANTALCPGEIYLLDSGLDTAIYNITWTKNGAILPGENDSTLTVTQQGTYGLTYDDPSDTCDPITNLIVIEYFSQISTAAPTALYKCDTGAASYIYDLSLNTPVLMAGQDPSTVISYHTTMVNAENNASPLPLSYSGTVGQTIYVRISRANCYIVKSFQLMVSPAPVAHQPADMTMCARNPTQFNATFTLTDQNSAILNGQPSDINIVSYYTSAADAATGNNPIALPYFFGVNNITVYVRVQNAFDAGCFSTTSFQLFVLPLPEVDVIQDVIVCENYVLPVLVNGNYFTASNGGGTPLFAGDVISETMFIHIFNQSGGVPNCTAASSFEVKVIDPLTLSPGNGIYCGSYTLPSLEYGDYFTQSGGNGTQLMAGSTIHTSQTVHIYYEALEAPFCILDISFDVTILPKPVVTNQADVFDCVSFTLPVLQVGNYYTEPNGGGSQVNAGTNIMSTQTLYIFAANTVGSITCTDQDSFTITIGFPAPETVSQCGPYTLPQLPIGGHYFTAAAGGGTEIAAGTVLTNTQTVHVYFPNNPSCMDNISFEVQISQPPIDTMQDVASCENYTLPVLTNGNYYTLPGGTGDQLQAGDVITETQMIYVFAQSDANCSNESTFTVTILPPPAIDSRSDIDVCNSYTLTELSAGNYYTGPGGTGTLLPAGTVLTESQFVYIYAESATTPVCTAESSFELFIFSVEADDPADVSACDSYVLPPLNIGNYYLLPGGPAGGEGTMMYAGDIITETTTLYIYTESGERINCHDENEFLITINDTPVVPAVSNKFACDTYTLPALAVGNYFTAAGGTGTMLNAGDVLTTSQTVYVFAETATTPNCTDETSFDVTIFNVDEQPDALTCDSFVLPALSIGKYYTGSGGTGMQLFAGSTISSSQTIYIYALSPFSPTCSDESSFDVTIIAEPIVNPIPASLLSVCDEDGTSDGTTVFDLTTLDATALGAQTGTEFNVAYYESLADANAETNEVVATDLALAYIRVNNLLAPDCFAIRAINIVVNKLPVPVPTNGTICFDPDTNTLLGSPYVIHSGLPPSQYTFQWLNQAGDVIATSANYVALLPGTFTVIATRISTGCASEPVTVTVSPSQPAIVTYTVSEDFADTQSVTVIASGIGDYEYQLDNGPFQDSNIFNHVSSGMHVITVRDKNGCGTETTSALVINYPHFFTPNGDGFNDNWNIKDLRLQSEAKINIYDRYGKLLTQIKPEDIGWDGTYNGHPMPATDYWFVVNYNDEDGQAKEFRSHFGMKR